MAKITPVNLSDYDRILTMTDLEAAGTIFYAANIRIEVREVIEQGEPPKVVAFASFAVLNADGEWQGDVTTRGVVANQIQRMLDHHLPDGAVVGPVCVVKGGQNGRSLYLAEAM